MVKEKLIPTLANILLIGSRYCKDKKHRIYCGIAYEKLVKDFARTAGFGNRRNRYTIEYFKNEPDLFCKGRVFCNTGSVPLDTYTKCIEVLPHISVVVGATVKYIYSDERVNPNDWYNKPMYKTVGEIIRPNISIYVTESDKISRPWTAYRHMEKACSYSVLKKHLKCIRLERQDRSEYVNEPGEPRLFIPKRWSEKRQKELKGEHAHTWSYRSRAFNPEYGCSIETNLVGTIKMVRFRNEDDLDFKDRLDYRKDLVYEAWNSHISCRIVTSREPEYPAYIAANEAGKFPPIVENNL